MSVVVPVTVVVPAKTVTVPGVTVSTSVTVPCPSDADFALALSRVSTLETDVAALKAAILPPVVVPPVVIDPRIQWKTGMETGDLSEWSGQSNSDSAISVAVQAAAEGIPARTPWVMKQSVTGPVGGTRMQRFPEIDKLARVGTPFYYSFLAYFPSQISFAPGNMFMLLGINSTTPQGVFSPTWAIYLEGINFTPTLGWSPNGMAPAEGPHAGESGRRAYYSSALVPIGSWVFFEVYIKPAADFTGAIKMWMDRAVLFDQSAVKTMHPINTLGGPLWIDKDAYGSSLTPTPAVHYVDDVTVSLGRMP